MIKHQLHSYFKNTFPDRLDLRVSELKRIMTGWETEIFSFDIDYTRSGKSKHENIIMRMFPSDDAYSKSAREYAAMKQLSAVNYPVPQMHHLERENSPWGKPFILMERIEGDIMWPQLIQSSSENQQALLTQFCDLFVQLHQLDWHSFAEDVSCYDMNNKYQFIDDCLEWGINQITLSNQTGFLHVISWLQERRDLVPCDQPSPIHFDFHPGNILLCPDKTAVVLDWSGFEISDARFDLAWTLVLFYSYEGSIWRERVLREYERLLGISVIQINYFEVYACTRRLFSIVASIQEGPEKMGMNPDAVVLMKQQMSAHQRVYDLLIEKTGIRIREVENMFV